MGFHKVLLISFLITSPLAALDNFGLVTQNVWRGGALSQHDYATLQELHIKTIINLQVTPDDQQLCEDHNLTCHHFPLIAIPLLGDKINFSLFYKALQTTLEAKKHGEVYIHCYHGSDRTGLLASALLIYEASQRTVYQSELVLNTLKEQLKTYHFHDRFYPNLEALILSWGENPPLWLKHMKTPPQHRASWVETILNSVTPLAVWLCELDTNEADDYCLPEQSFASDESFPPFGR